VDEKDLRSIVVEERATMILHLSAKLSKVAEMNPGGAFGVNVRSVENVFEVARHYGLRVYSPSSIAAFGPTTPNLSQIVDDVTIQRPLNVYGVAKVYMEVRFLTCNVGKGLNRFRLLGFALSFLPCRIQRSRRPVRLYVCLIHQTLGEWYNYRYGLDFRSLRYPGILSADTVRCPTHGRGQSQWTLCCINMSLRRLGARRRNDRLCRGHILQGFRGRNPRS
jgi:threonine 3-dehydrogenase